MVLTFKYRYFTDNGDGKGLSKRVISERWRCRFLQTEILCAEYAGLEQKQEEDLFSRVQLGVPLTPAEKLKASSGAWQAFAIEIEKRFPELMDSTHSPSQSLICGMKVIGAND